MRITNKMMTNNVMHNISNNKHQLSNLENQYSTGKKIQKPSDDPIVAVRALKLRTNLWELNQYVDKNIEDALAWMDTTEGSIDVINEVLREMNTYCNQGANDPLTAKDRNSIVQNLKELKDHIYQEGNSNYAGRYVFSGYKTDTPLVFNEDTKDYSYVIHEPLSCEAITTKHKIVNVLDLNQYKQDPNAYTVPDMPNEIQYYRMRLAYSGLEDGSITYKDPNTGTDVTITPNMMSINDNKPYEPAAGTINFIKETGELILSEDMYGIFRRIEEKDIVVTYTKDSFETNELRPEHYFTCERTDLKNPKADPIKFTKADQQIQYEVNFNQKLTINTQGDAAFSHDIGRAMDDIINAVNDVMETENKITEVEKMLKDTTITPAQREKLEEIMERLESEFTLRTDVMQAAFSGGLTDTTNLQDKVNVAVSDLGGRYNRLLLTKSRLKDQQVDFEELLSNNEDVDLVDTIIKYSSVETLYKSSLSAASKLVQTTLLDFI